MHLCRIGTEHELSRADAPLFFGSHLARLGSRGIGLASNCLERAETAPQGLSPGVAGFPQFPAKAKRVIFLCMAGGPSHLETFDYKPELARLHGQPMPESITAGQPIAQLQGQKLVCQGPLLKFRRWGPKRPGNQ